MADYFNLRNIERLDGQPEVHTISHQNTKFLIDELFSKIVKKYEWNERNENSSWSLVTVDEFIWVRAFGNRNYS